MLLSLPGEMHSAPPAPHRLRRGATQPFYWVLVDCRDRAGNQSTYVAAENIQVIGGAAEQVEHEQVCWLFDHYVQDQGYYEPTPAVKRQFPDDCVQLD